jgi:hypothetical protein
VLDAGEGVELGGVVPGGTIEGPVGVDTGDTGDTGTGTGDGDGDGDGTTTADDASDVAADMMEDAGATADEAAADTAPVAIEALGMTL